MEGLNDTSVNLLASIQQNAAEIAPSTLYAVACIQEGVPFINGSPQNTFVPGKQPIQMACIVLQMKYAVVACYCHCITIGISLCMSSNLAFVSSSQCTMAVSPYVLTDTNPAV